ncbi:MAG: LysR family transcriptional regulator [Paracoccaceae bacterium]
MAIGSSLDWTLLQSFAAVAKHGSLSAAARNLGASQPTLGRHIKTLEESLGAPLFTRIARGLEPTELGLELLEEAGRMEAAAARMSLIAEGRSTALRGTVRITASVFVSHFILPQIIADIRRQEPQIEIELAPSDATENLMFREADIALRMYRPEQLDVITRYVGDTQIGLYGARGFLDRVGRPETFEAAFALDFVGYDRNDLMLRGMRQMGLEIDRDFFAVRCDDQAAYWHLVRAGCGIGAAQRIVGDRDALVERILPDLPLPPLPIWLAAPEALRRNPRIRRVWDLLGEGLTNAGIGRPVRQENPSTA